MSRYELGDKRGTWRHGEPEDRWDEPDIGKGKLESRIMSIWLRSGRYAPAEKSASGSFGPVRGNPYN